MTIDWENGQLQINAPHLQHLLRSIRREKENFESISFQHIYRELNVEANKLSKEALLLSLGIMEISDYKNNMLEALFLPLGIMEVKDYENNLLVNQYVRL